jgi:hypothetical protein
LLLNEEGVEGAGKNELQPRACPRFEECGASLCPLSPNVGVWFRGEPTCRSRRHGAGLRWLQVQRRIARLENVEGYFTQADLEQVRKVRRGIRGRDPDADRRQSVGAQRRKASRDGAVRVCDRRLDSEPRAETSRAVDALSASTQSAGSVPGLDMI